MSTRVVNVRAERPAVYIGRGTPFGNPFTVQQFGRDRCLQLYREWFHDRLKQPAFAHAVRQLQGKTLGCHCKPAACHGDIIVEWLNSEVNQMGFAEIQAAFAANGAAPTPVQPTPAQAPAFAPTFQPAPAPAFPTPSFAPAAAPASLQGSFAFTPPPGFNPSSAPPINPPGERAALTAPEPTPAAAAPAVEDPDPPHTSTAKAKRGRKPKAEEPARVVDFSNGDVTVAALPGSLAPVQPSIEALVQALYALGVSSVHLTFSKE